MKEKTVLIIDDEINILHSLKRQLTSLGYKVFTSSNIVETSNILENEIIKVVICDQRMPGISGSALLAQIRKKYPNTIRMIISGYTDFNSLQAAINQGEIFHFIPKPWDATYLVNILEKAFNLYEDLEKKDRHYKILDNAINCIAITNKDDTIESGNLSFLLTTGYTVEQTKKKIIWDVFSDFATGNKLDVISEIDTNHTWQGEANLILQNGSKVSGFLSINETTNNENETYRSFSFFNVPELKQKDAELETSIHQDPETGILNRTGFQNELSNLICANLEESSRFYIMAFYFENFPPLASLVGEAHSADIALKIINVIKQSMIDINLCGRTQQNVVMIAKEKALSKESIVKILNIIAMKFKDPFVIKNQNITLTPAIGISTYPDTADNASLLIDQAQLAAQYCAEKHQEIMFYNENIDNEMKLNLYIESEVINLIHRHAYEIKYLSVFDIHARVQDGLEAVVDLPVFNKMIISYSAFIAKAHQLNLIETIERNVIFNAYQKIKKEMSTNAAISKMYITISPQHIVKPELLKFLKKIIVDNNVSADKLILQIKQGVWLESIHLYLKSVADIRKLGIKIALDDFDGGYNAMRALVQCPIDIVKIDHSLLASICEYEQYSKILFSIVNLCKTMGLSVVLKGVDSIKDVQFIRDLGCDFIQGTAIQNIHLGN